MKRVAIIGAESTGKTTVSAALAKHYKTVWVPEYARKFLEARGGRRLLEYMVPIALGHLDSEKEQMEKANGLLFSDSCLLATAIWSEHYFGVCDKQILDLVETEHYDLYILLTKDFPWVNDGLRDSEKHREWFEKRLLSELQSRKLPFIAVAGTMEQRITRATKAVDHIMKR